MRIATRTMDLNFRPHPSLRSASLITALFLGLAHCSHAYALDDDPSLNRALRQATTAVRAYEILRFEPSANANLTNNLASQAIGIQSFEDFLRIADASNSDPYLISLAGLNLAYAVTDEFRVALLTAFGRTEFRARILEAEMVRVIANETRKSPNELGSIVGITISPEAAAFLPGVAAADLFRDLDLVTLAHGFLRGSIDAQGRVDQGELYSRVLRLMHIARLPFPESSLTSAVLDSARAYGSLISARTDAENLKHAERETLFSRSTLEQLWQLGKRQDAIDKWRTEMDGWRRATDSTAAEFKNQISAINRQLEEHARKLAQHDADIAGLKEAIFPRDISAAERIRLLRRFAPIFRFDDEFSGPVMSPGDFVKDCELLNGPSGEIWTAEKLVAELEKTQLEPPDGRLLDSVQMEIIPSYWRRRGLFDSSSNGNPRQTTGPMLRREINKQSIEDLKGVFGDVRNVGDAAISIKYFMFLGLSVGPPSLPDGLHEGDWISVDIQLDLNRKPETTNRYESVEVSSVIFHQHGSAYAFPRSDLVFEGEQLVVFLERGSNEPHHRAGEKGAFVEPHYGNAFHYNTRPAVIDLAWANLVNAEAAGASADKVQDAKLVMLWRGQWGEYDDDDFKSWWGGRDVTNPHGPPYQDKMWNRSSLRDKANPLVQ